MPSFAEQRERMVQSYRRLGYIKTDEMARAILRVPREEFVHPEYADYAYGEQPLPIPGDGRQTISAPYMYPICYEPLELKPGDKVLEVGSGSGYGAALAWELVRPTGLVVSIEINAVTHQFAEANLRRTGYSEVLLVRGDGSKGHPEKAPYDAICVTAACPEIPQPLVEQLGAPGRLVAPVGHASNLFGQDLVLLTKEPGGRTSRRVLMQVAYVPLIGEHGWRRG